MEPGKAYAFFECRASADAVKAEIPTLRRLVQTPSDLELAFYDSPVHLPRDANLEEFVQLAVQARLRYALEALWPQHDGREVLAKLVSVMNQMYHTPLYGKDEEYRGEIVYKEGGQYLRYQDG